MQLYNQPALWEALRAPEPVTLQLVRQIIRQHIGPGPFRVMDPACGPGTWLVPFISEASRIAGNDLSPEMVRFAKERLEGHDAEIIEGDMRELWFKTGPFDVALELGGSTAHLPDVDGLVALLKAVARNLRAGGVFVLLLHLEPSLRQGTGPALCWQAGPVELPKGGRAWIQYEVVDRDAKGFKETMKRTVRTEGAEGFPRQFHDTYQVHIWSTAEVQKALGSTPELQLVGICDTEDDAVDEANHCDLVDERILILKKVSASAKATTKPGTNGHNGNGNGNGRH